MTFEWNHEVEGPQRDLVGYGANIPKVRWPGDARVAVSIVVNYEEGSERSFAHGDRMNEPGGGENNTAAFSAEFRDLANESVFEYGSRAGIHRLLRLFRRYDIKCTAYACAVALAVNREVAESFLADGHEIASHGYRWSQHWRMARDQEREEIAKAVRLFREVCGVRPKGWYCRYAPSIHTRELLVEAGFEYDNDAYNDDLPYYVNVAGRRHLVLPYSQVHNDARLISGQIGGPDAFASLLKRAFDYLWDEGADYPKMMSIGLHPRYIGQPGRASALKEFIEHALGKGHVWFARRDEIAAWWNANHESFVRAGQHPPR
jgi:peptidoglycan/xylan/chitin deacetylase (PgdA/CDA1 family)